MKIEEKFTRDRKNKTTKKPKKEGRGGEKVVPCRFVSCPVMSYRVVSCRVVWDLGVIEVASRAGCRTATGMGSKEEVGAHFHRNS